MKLNKKGFTLIELLAVITIMGILMMVAIPAVSRTIENSRRDTFGDVALNYVNTVRTSVLADELTCHTATNGKAGSDTRTYASLPDGLYIFYLATDATVIDNTGNAFQGNYGIAADTVVQNTLDLMESGGKSSWGNNHVFGYVMWTKVTQANGNIKTTFSVLLQDAARHGMASETQSEQVGRSKVTSTISGATGKLPVTPQTVSKVFKTKNGANEVDATINYVCELA